MEWREVLMALEHRLADLEAHGVRHLNVAADPALAELLRWTPRTAPTAPPRPAPLVRPVPADPASPDAAPSAEEPRQAPGEIGSIESLLFQFRNCTRCKLAAGRTRLVFGVGETERPRLMFIGEGPGADEDRQGLPFVGRAGRLLTGFIEALGLTRDDVYITNVVKCRPPGNRNPEADEIAACRPILQRQIELLDPALIVVLGNVPLRTLNPAAGGITRERGRPFTYQRWQVLPTFHPSYLLRNSGALAACWADFRQAFALAYDGERP